MKDYQRILEAAVANRLPDRIDESSEYHVLVVKELVNASYLDAADACSDDGDVFLEPRITLAGREYLARLNTKGAPTGVISSGHQFGRSSLTWVFGILGSVIAGLILYWLLGS